MRCSSDSGSEFIIAFLFSLTSETNLEMLANRFLTLRLHQSAFISQYKYGREAIQTILRYHLLSWPRPCHRSLHLSKRPLPLDDFHHLPCTHYSLHPLSRDPTAPCHHPHRHPPHHQYHPPSPRPPSLSSKAPSTPQSSSAHPPPPQ